MPSLELFFTLNFHLYICFYDSAKTVFDQFKEKSYPHDLLIFGIEMQRHREICHKVDRNSDFYIKFAQLGFEELIKYEDIGDEEILEIDR